LDLLARSADVDLLVTDVGLPNGLNGRQVADAARERIRGLPVLFITGYTGPALTEHLEADMQMIGKPFTLDALAAKIAAMLMK
jgi:CheY-like chemotaxis protein